MYLQRNKSFFIERWNQWGECFVLWVLMKKKKKSKSTATLGTQRGFGTGCACGLGGSWFVKIVLRFLHRVFLLLQWPLWRIPSIQYAFDGKNFGGESKSNRWRSISLRCLFWGIGGQEQRFCTSCYHSTSGMLFQQPMIALHRITFSQLDLLSRGGFDFSCHSSVRWTICLRVGINRKRKNLRFWIWVFQIFTARQLFRTTVRWI